jgi:cob(I)alamin adenosyltransferase
MSISTKRGDRGETDLMYGRRVAKSDFRIAACGGVDELGAALGLVRAHAAGKNPETGEIIADIQEDLVAVMGELATDPEDLPRYEKDGHPIISDKEVKRLDALVEEIEALGMKFTGWAMPGTGGSPTAAALDFARAVCRRAERDIVDLAETEDTFNEALIRYLNRLSDVLWLLARKIEKEGE